MVILDRKLENAYGYGATGCDREDGAKPQQICKVVYQAQRQGADADGNSGPDLKAEHVPKAGNARGRRKRIIADLPPLRAVLAKEAADGIEKKGYLYVILTGDGHAKVGFTAVSPIDRLLAVMVDYRGGSAVLARAMDGSRIEERDAHRALRAFRLPGSERKSMSEWYGDQAAVLSYFAGRAQAVCKDCGHPWSAIRKGTRYEHLARLAAGGGALVYACSFCRRA